MKRTSFFILALMILGGSISAQKIKSVKGDLNFLKNEKQLNVEFDYSGMTVGKELTEEEYVNEKVTEHNKKEAGKGDKWKEGWIGAREARYEPKFMELFNDHLSKTGITASEDGQNAKYTLIVKTIYTEPGFHVGVMKMPSYVHFEYIFVETANRNNVVASFTQNKVPGSQAMGYDFDAGSRIAESYAKGGKMLAKFITKEL